MDIITFVDFNAVLFPLGTFGILLAIWQFSSDYAKEGVLQLFMPKQRAYGAYGMMNKAFAFLGYVVFGLILLVGIWIIIAVINTLIQSFVYHKDIPTQVIIFCFAFIIIIIVSLILMIWRDNRTKHGEIHPAVIDASLPAEDTATTIRRCLKLAEENGKAVDRILAWLERQDGDGSNSKS